MRVGVFDQYGALNSPPVWEAIKSGLDKIGVKHTAMDSSADVAIIWSQVWHGRMRPNQQVWQHFRSSGRPVIVVEVGFLRRGSTWKLGVNGTGSAAYWGRDIQPGRAEKLGVRLEPWRKPGYNIVIACQRSDSEQWAGQPPTAAWLTETARRLREHTDRPLVIRPHPRQRIINIPGCVIESPQPVPGTYDDFDRVRSFNTAWAVINHNSGMGPMAIMHGVPAFVHSSSLAAPVANLDLAAIENPQRPDREAWLDQIAHTEWLNDEIATGEPLTRLLDL